MIKNNELNQQKKPAYLGQFTLINRSVYLCTAIILSSCTTGTDDPPPYPTTEQAPSARDTMPTLPVSEVSGGDQDQVNMPDMSIAGQPSGGMTIGGEQAGDEVQFEAGEVMVAGDDSMIAGSDSSGEEMVEGGEVMFIAGEEQMMGGEEVEGGSVVQAVLPNRLNEPLDQVLAGITHYAPIDLNGDGISTDREVQITGLAHPLLLPREAVVYLPEAYFNDPTQSFPVLYAHDAQNLFSPFAPFGEWRLDEVIDVLTSQGFIEPHIIVGVNHTSDRIFDYTASSLEVDGETIGGGAAAYAELFVNQLKPYVDLHFRTLSDRSNTTLLGSSLGGLVSMYIYAQAHSTFGKIAAVSASLWWPIASDPEWRWLTNDVEQQLPLPDRVWIDIGGAEASRTFLQQGSIGNYTRHPYQALMGELRSRGMQWGPQGSLGYLEDPFADHHEPAWARRLPHMLRFLLSSDRPTLPNQLSLTIDQPHLTSGRSCEVADLSLEARYGDGLRLTVPNDLVAFTSLTPWIDVNDHGQVSVAPDLFEPGGLLASGNPTTLQGEIEAQFEGLTTRVKVSAGVQSSPYAQLVVYAPARPNSIDPSSDQLYVASPLSEPVWSPTGFPLNSLDSLSSRELLIAVGGQDRWWGQIPVLSDPDGANGANQAAGECAPSCAATQISLKITRGSWTTVEGAAVNVDRPNHELSLPLCQQEAEVFVDAWLDGE